MPRLQFNIKFRTQYGQELLVMGNSPVLGQLKREQAVPMRFLDQETWQLDIDVPLRGKNTQIQYKYLLKNQDGTLLSEWGDDRVILLQPSTSSCILYDTWNHAGDFENAFFTTPFQEVLLTKRKVASKKLASGTHIFRVKAPLIQTNQQICLLGDTQMLGNWSAQKPILLQKKNNWWEVALDLANQQFPISYKYGVWDSELEEFIQFEGGENRQLPLLLSQPSSCFYIHDGFIRLPNTSWRGAGVSIPVFSLRTRQSFGIGEFTDIKKLADWSHAAGLRLIQLLPINDTIATQTWQDSYPYAAISAFALHPIYINLAQVAGTKQAVLLRPLRKIQDQLNSKPAIDYEAVIRIKLETLQKLYDALGTDTIADPKFQEFFQKNRHWLKPYSAFCYYRDQFGTTQFENWPIGSKYEAESVEHLFKSVATRTKVLFYSFVQFHLHLQLKEAVAYTHEKGLVLKGDIPIGIYRYGVDAWVDPSLYNMDWQAGAPPDDFTAIGQNWGFPTYNWKKMQEDGFAWWKQRFEQMSHYFDTFRIDHILGFFRIWSIPTDAVQGVLGRFVPCLPINRDEFLRCGIEIDYNRYCRSYINEEVLLEIFGEQQFNVKEQFLIRDAGGNWTFSPLYDSQLKVERYFDSIEKNHIDEKIKAGLLELHANIILFEEPNSNGSLFHFRIGIEKTWSFKQLTNEVKSKLLALYHDYFYRRQDHFWYQEAMQKLPFLKEATNMLICGEDLGMVPHCVPDVMKQTGILSLEIQRMPKDPTQQFFNPAQAPYLSVVTPSTHDMSTIRGWWEENRSRTQQFYNQIMEQWGEAPQFCEAWINRAIVTQHLRSPAMWSIFQLQDLLGMSESVRRVDPREERINDPANPKHYWQYRLHLHLEDLIENKDFTTLVRQSVVEAGRI